MKKLNEFIFNNYRKTNIIVFILALIIDILFVKSGYCKWGDNLTINVIATILIVIMIIFLLIISIGNIKNNKLSIVNIIIALSYTMSIKSLYFHLSFEDKYSITFLKILFLLHYLIYVVSIMNILRKNKYNQEEKMLKANTFINILIVIELLVIIPFMNNNKMPFNESLLSAFFWNNNIFDISYIDFISGDEISLLFIKIIFILIIIFNVVIPIIKKEKIKLRIIPLLFIIVLIINFITVPPFAKKYYGRVVKCEYELNKTCHEETYEFELFHIFRLYNTNEGIYEERFMRYYVYNPFNKELTVFYNGDTEKYNVIKYDDDGLILENNGERDKYEDMGYVYDES